MSECVHTYVNSFVCSKCGKAREGDFVMSSSAEDSGPKASLEADLHKLYGTNLELQNLGAALLVDGSVPNEMKKLIRQEMELNQKLLDSLSCLQFKKEED